MPAHIQFGRVDLTTEGEPSPAGPPLGDDRPFRIGILGNFRGRRREDPPAGALGNPIRVDRDNLDTVLSRLDVGLVLELPGSTAPLSLGFRTMDDFHPDRLLKTEAFRSLREARQRLADPVTFRETAAELGLLASAEPLPHTHSPAPHSGSAAAPPDLLDQILKQTDVEGLARSGEDTVLQAYLDRLTAPYSSSKDPRQAEVIAGVEAGMTRLLREVLHHPDFQALESAWRWVHLLTRRLDTDGALAIELIDTTRADLEADLLSATPPESTSTFKHLVEETVGSDGGRPWTLLVGNFTFEPSRRDVALLWRLGQVARHSGAPFVAAASPRFVGSDALAAAPDPEDWGKPPEVEGWAGLRHSAEAPYLGLALPRVLLRAPYGAKSDRIDTFPFEELGATPAHEAYLWGNPAFAPALLLGRAFGASGWSWPLSIDPEIGGLPMPIERHDHESVAKPCAEVLLGRRAVDRMLAAGLMPVVSVRDRDAVDLSPLRSIAEPEKRLAVRHL